MKLKKLALPAAFTAATLVLAAMVLNLGEQAYFAGCVSYGADDQQRLKCKKMARASSWGFRGDVQWGDEVYRWDSDLQRYQPDSIKVDKTKYRQ